MKTVIYQLVIRYFGNTNTTNQKNGSLSVNGCGRFEDVNATALESIRALGATHVWLTGCLRQATLTDYPALGLPAEDPDVVKGIAGSFYAIRDYFDVCPDYARDPADRLVEFDALVQRVHGAGMKAVIDFVPNHVARGYESVVKPELNFGKGDDTSKFFDRDNHFFYLVEPPGQKLRLTKPPQWDAPGLRFDGDYAREDGSPGRPPKVTGNNSATPNPSLYDWYETVKLNYGYNFADRTGHYAPPPRTWGHMDQILAFWQARGVDGFRCDFAHYVPAEAWAFLVGAARRRDADAYFFAEAYPYADSGDPVTDMQQLVDAGFDAVYHDDSYHRLKRIYQGAGGQDDYHQAMTSLSPVRRKRFVQYLENHDERRIGSPVVTGVWPGDSGFGTADAGYLLAPLQYLFGSGPVLMLNGQEVGEPGAGAPGYSGEDGRTTLFDYYCMPEFVKWVNGHAYDGGRLSAQQKGLRAFYAALLALCRDPAVGADSYWGLKYYNRPERFGDCPGDVYTFARFEDGGGRLLLVAGNFRRDAAVTARLRVPPELAELCGLAGDLAVRLLLDRGGAKSSVVATLSRQELIDKGFEAVLPGQTSQVYSVGSASEG